MECKLSYLNQGYTGFRELIETLWNVNIRKEPGTSLVTYELIETLWNVNVPGTYAAGR